MPHDDPIRSAREELADQDIPRSSEPPVGEQAGDTIDRYKLLQQIGEGGMGTVWMAEQSEPVRRRVALKIIKLGMDTKEVIARFEAERQALAMMDHPHIARVFDGGVTATGRPFFVMELVRGVPVTEHCDTARLGLRERLRLFVQICGALQHAHQKGIIHRDIKPSNVLVTLHDGAPVPKVIDFGIAKATNSELTQRTLFTQYAQMIGTPEYMAPEQAEMSGLDIDTRADVYSLGVLLYELVTGSKPFDLHTALEKGYAELLRTIREVEPARPSTRVSTRGRRVSPVGPVQTVDVEALSRRLRGDLDCIVMKALEKDRQRRYETASSLAEDIDRYLADEPVRAMPPSRFYRLRKAFRRNRRGFVAAGAAATLLLLGGVGTTFGMLRARAAEGEAVASRDAADLARREAEAVAEFSSEMLKGVDPRTAEGRDTRLLRGLMDDALARIEAGSLADVPRAELRLRSTLGTVYAAISEFESALRTLQPAVALAEEAGADGPGSLAGILASIGRAHMRLSRLREAREWFGRALGVLDEVDEAGGDARLARANLHSDLSLLSEKEGDLEAAEQLCRRSVATKRELGGGEGTRLAATLGILGSILSRAGDLDGSAAAFDEALELARSYARSGDVVSLQVALGNSAYIHGILGDEQRAEQLHRESLKLGEQIFDGDHMFLAAAHAGLSASLSAQGRPLEALPHQQAAYEMCRRLFPAGHPELVRATCGLARQLSDLGRFREADELAAEAVRCAARLAPPDPSAELQALQVRGRVLGRLGKLEAAERVLREAVALDRSLQTETAGDVFYANSTADVLVNLATVLQRAEQVEERRALLREAVARYRETAPPTGSLELANALDNLGEALDGDEGERLLREALAMKRALFEGPHQDVATTALKLGRRLAARRDFAAAEPLLREAVRMRVEVLGADSIGTARARFDLAELMFGAGEDAERSAELVAGCLEVARAAQPADHHLIAAAGARYVEVLIQRGDLETALRVAREALAANREVESPPGVNVAIALVNLGVVHQRRGAAQQAIDCFVESGQLFEAEGVAPNQNAVPMFFLLARLHVSAGDEDAAIRSFERLFAMADRLGDAPAPMRVQAASELLEIQRRRGQHADALRAAQRLVAAADAVYADPSVARRPFVRSMARTEVVAEQLALAATRESVEERLRLLDAAETTAREVLAIREPMRTQDGYAWMLVDGSSLLGEVLLARAIALRHQDPAAAAGALEEARRRIPEAAEALWADTWKPGHRPPTAPQAARRMVVLLRHLAELEPEDGHAAQIDVWQQRASR